jgi:hypothetical protein
MPEDSKKKPLCDYCHKEVTQCWGAINRALQNGKPIYCDRSCAGLGRRSTKTVGQKKEAKRSYDEQYRADNRDQLKTDKAAWYQRTHDPEKEASKRKKTMPRHVEYCRQPEYVAWKRGYDRQYRAKKYYGYLWEAAIILWDLEQEVGVRQKKIDKNIIANTLNKKQTRRRDYERLNSNKS